MFLIYLLLLFTGVRGAPGYNGAKGEPGNSGYGVAGAPGPAGAPGQKGERGKHYIKAAVIYTCRCIMRLLHHQSINISESLLKV